MRRARLRVFVPLWLILSLSDDSDCDQMENDEQGNEEGGDEAEGEAPHELSGRAMGEDAEGACG